MRALLLTLALALTLAAPADGFIYQLGRGYGVASPNYGARVANSCTSSMSFPAGGAYTHHLLRAYTDTDANSYVSTGVALGGGFGSPIFYADNVVDGQTRNAMALGGYTFGTEHSFAILRGGTSTWNVFIDGGIRASFSQPGGRVVHLIEAGALSTSDGAQERGSDYALQSRANGGWAVVWTSPRRVQSGAGGFRWADANLAGTNDQHYLGSAGFGYC